jgi:CRP-like cAMP-binding protein
MKLSPVQLREQAAQLRATGEHLAAIRIYLALLSRNPEDYRTRMHLADALAQADVTAGAVKVYRTVANLCIAGGRPLVAMVACRAMEALGESAESLLARLSQLFGQGSGHLGETGPGLRIRREDYQVDAKELRTGRTVEQLVAEAVQVGSQVEGLEQLPGKFFPIPLLSELSPPTLLAVERTMTVHRLPAGHVVFRQDEPGRSCFLLASGAVRVLMRQPGGEEAAVASLSDGAIFGEMSLITGSPRSATVQVTEESDLLELGPESLAAIGDELPRLASALDRLAQKRWMSNLMRQSPVFSAFNEGERLELLKHFSAHEVPQGTVLIPQGVEVDGIYLVLRGEVGMVHREGKGQPRVVSRVGPGSTLGLEYLVRGQPAAASATTMTPAMVLFLSASRVLRLVEAVPEFAEAIRTSAPPL